MAKKSSTLKKVAYYGGLTAFLLVVNTVISRWYSAYSGIWDWSMLVWLLSYSLSIAVYDVLVRMIQGKKWLLIPEAVRGLMIGVFIWLINGFLITVITMVTTSLFWRAGVVLLGVGFVAFLMDKYLFSDYVGY